MTIATTTNKSIGLGNGVSTNWPFLFIIPLASQLYVYYTDDLGNITTIPAGSYSVAGLDNPDGGSVTYPLSGTPIASGTTLTVYRLVPYQQLTDVTNQGAFYPEVYEDALDYITMEIQQLAEIQNRSLVLPVSTQGVSTTLPAPTAGYAIGWNSGGTALTNLAALGSIGVPVSIAQGGTGQTGATAALAALAAEAVSLTGDISPTQLAANTDNWAPTGFSTCSTIRFSTNAARNLTGIAGGADGRVVILHNIGSFTCTLMNNVTSTAANRFQLSADYALGANQSAAIQYDATSSRWRLLGQTTATAYVPPTGSVANAGATATPSANTLILALKDATGADASATSTVDFYVQSATLTTGTTTKRQVSAASSITIPNTALVGTVSGFASRIYFGYLDNAGTMEPCFWNPIIRDANGKVTGIFRVDKGGVYTTVANTTASDSAGVIYSTSARSNVRVIPVAYVDSVQAAAGVWATALDKLTIIGPDTPTTGQVMTVTPVTVTVATFSTGSASLVDITGMTVTTPAPSSKSNIFEITSSLCTGGISGAIHRVLALRGSTGILLGDAAGSRVQVSAAGGIGNSGGALLTTSLQGYDAPDTTSAVTYKLQASTDSTFYLNRSATDTDAATFQRGASTLTVKEICA